MDRTKCRQIENEAVEALQVLLGEKYGVKVSFKGGQIGGGFCVLKVEFAEVKTDGSVETKEASNYKLNASLYGLPADGMGKTFHFRSRTYKVVGLKPGCKYNILAERQPDGKRFCFQDRTAFPSLRKPLFGSRHAPGLDSEADDNDAEREIAEAEGS